jgi:uncharacterized protein
VIKVKVLLFTHIADIDGINAIILAKQAFNNVDYVLCEAYDVDDKFIELQSQHMEYDYIFITDLCLSPQLLSNIESSVLKHRIRIFDHHQNRIEELDKLYDFVTIKIENERGKCCGTSLYYQYLIDNNYLKPTTTLNKIVELTRKYDTWEWKIDNDTEACNLTYLFNVYGINDYIKLMLNKVNKSKFSFTPLELNRINEWKEVFNTKIKKTVDKIQYLKILDYSAGIVDTIYEYRNDVAEYVRNNKYDIDFLVLVFSDKDSISYRSIRESVDVSIVAKFYGGSGHKAAASSVISNNDKNNIIDYFKRSKINNQ